MFCDDFFDLSIKLWNKRSSLTSWKQSEASLSPCYIVYVARTNSRSCTPPALCYCAVHMCGAILSAFRLAGHVRQSPHLGTEAAVLLWPLTPWTHSQASTGQHRPVRTQHNRRAEPLTGKVVASDQMLRGCVWIYIRLCFLPKPNLKGTAVS